LRPATEILEAVLTIGRDHRALSFAGLGGLTRVVAARGEPVDQLEFVRLVREQGARLAGADGAASDRVIGGDDTPHPALNVL